MPVREKEPFHWWSSLPQKTLFGRSLTLFTLIWKFVWKVDEAVKIFSRLWLRFKQPLCLPLPPHHRTIEGRFCDKQSDSAYYQTIVQRPTHGTHVSNSVIFSFYLTVHMFSRTSHLIYVSYDLNSEIWKRAFKVFSLHRFCLTCSALHLPCQSNISAWSTFKPPKGERLEHWSRA